MVAYVSLAVCMYILCLAYDTSRKMWQPLKAFRLIHEK
jgi:hypothetical protein